MAKKFNSTNGLFYFQVRGHGAEYDGWEVYRVGVLPLRCPGHRATCSGHRVQLLPHLPSEPAGGQTQGSKGIIY
jgi:hypothetical protein